MDVLLRTGTTMRTLPAGELSLVHEQILTPAFPRDELVDLDDLIRDVSEGNTEVRVAEEAGELVAVAVTELLLPSSAVLLAYLAVRPGRRGGGIGGLLLAATLDAVVSHVQPSMIIGEVELPGRRAATLEYGDPEDRIRFYGRHGARVLDLPYFQPPVAPGISAVYEMALLALRVRPDLDLGDRLAPGPETTAVLATMMEDATQVDADEVDGILAAAADQAGVRLRPVEEINEVPVVLPPEHR